MNGETAGIIYGIIKIETINEKYNNMEKELAATTDSLTGVLNRVAYKNDILVFVEENSVNNTLWVFARDQKLA